jgi:hypothetical protein
MIKMSVGFLFISNLKNYCMKPVKRKSAAIKCLLLISVCTTLFSFSAGKGGESFEIYLNGKMAIQQYVAMQKGIKSIQLDQSLSNDELTIYYSHCGKTGTDRTITIKDGQNRALKAWRFPNDAATRAAMNCKVKDILSLQKNGSAELNLYYSSRELPEGRLLASVIIANDNKTAFKH